VVSLIWEFAGQPCGNPAVCGNLCCEWHMFLESKTTNGQTMSNNACLFSISTLIIPCQHPFCHFPHQAAKNWLCLQIGHPKVSCLIKVFPQLPRHKDHVWDNIQSHTVACASCRKPCPTISQEHLVGGWPTPLKNTSESVGMIIPNIWNKTCSKPSISYGLHQ
jgi:hypothetical protein